MKNLRKLTALLIVLILLATLLPMAAISSLANSSPSMANFTRVHAPADHGFTDIAHSPTASEWAPLAFAYDIMAGVGGGRFDPNGNFTYAQAITVAAKMHAIFTTGSTEAAGDDFPASFVAYAEANGIIPRGAYDDRLGLGDYATRQDMINIWSNIIPESQFDRTLNTVYAIPDTNNPTVIMFYEAGIVTGRDATGAFGGNDLVTREQCAVILVRIAAPMLRNSGMTFGTAPTYAEADEDEDEDEDEPEENEPETSEPETNEPGGSPGQHGASGEPNNQSDHNPANLRDSRNEVILANDVQVVSAPQGVNMLISVDEANRRYTFDNIDNSIRNLAIGDRFIIYPCESVPEGVSIIVASIEIIENRATITSEEVFLWDIVESMDVAQIVPMTGDAIISFGEGVEPIWGTRASLGGATVNFPTLNVTVPLDDNVRVTGTITMASTLKADINLSEGWFNIPTGLDFFEVSLNNRMQSTLRLTAMYQNELVDMASVYRVRDGRLVQKYQKFNNMTRKRAAEYTRELFTSAFPIPTAPGLAATVTFYLRVTAEGRISIEAVYTKNNTLGVRFQNGQWSPINESDNDFSVIGAAEASLFAGVGVDVGLSFVRIVAATIGPEVGVELRASTQFNPAALLGESNIPHDCVLCIDGGVYLRVRINANVTAIGFGNVLSSELLNRRRSLGGFFFSLGNNVREPEFGWTECPHIHQATGGGGLGDGDGPGGGDGVGDGTGDGDGAGTGAGGGGLPPTPTPPPATDVNVGETIQFGGHNWRVLDVQSDRKLIITENLIERRRYHNTWTNVTWEHSDIRRWLNNEFLNGFNQTDRARIRQTTVINNDNPWSNTPGGEDTQDHIFLLSLEELVQYFGDSGELGRGRNGRWWFTDQYANNRIARFSNGTASWWWLRSPGSSPGLAADVDDDGGVGVNGGGVNRGHGGVRPALWLNL